MEIGFIVGGVILAVIVILLMVFITKYKTVGPDEALIVTGSYLSGKNVVTSEDSKKIKIVRGGGTFVVPVFQQSAILSLLNHKLEVAVSSISKQGVPINVHGVSIVKVGGTIGEISTAAEQYLGKTDDELRTEAREVLEGHLRAIVSGLTVEQVYSDRESFQSKVLEIASIDLHKMGLQIISFTIKDISDKNGYLQALGEPQIAAVKRDAAIAKADADRDSRIRNAQAEKEAQEKELQRDAEIASAEKEKEIKIAQYKIEQDTKKAEADQAYNLQTAVAKQRVVEEEMKIQIIERERQIELEEKEIKRREKQLDADIKKKAEADRYAVEQAAEADKAKKMREADAMKYQIEAEARARAEEVRVEGFAKADIDKAQGVAIAEAERAKGTADAEVIRLKGLAEAEAKEKLAEAFDKFGEAAVLDIVVKMLPAYAKEVAAPLASIDKITVVDTGSNGENSGANRVTGYATNLMGTLQETLKATSGIDFKSLLESFAGKGNAVRQSIDSLSTEVAKKNALTMNTQTPEVNDELPGEEK